MNTVFDVKSPARRVPETARRRAQTSCDRCKTRRIRCVRSNDQESCKACLDASASCEATIRRKKRIFVAEDGSARRYQALEALVKGLFPHEPFLDDQTLFRLAAERNISIPSPDEEPSSTRSKEDVFPHALSGTGPSIVHAPSSHRASFGPVHSPATLTPATVTQASPYSVSAPALWPCNIDPAVQGAVKDLPEETCIPAPHGVAHYVGPASSFEFASAVRRLVSMRSQALEDAQTRRDRRSRLRADFANLRTSIALEPRIQAHPASTVREQSSDEQIPDSHTTPAISNPREAAFRDKQENRAGSPSRRWIQTLVPSRDVSDKLVESFFQHLHPNYPLFHRGTFHTRYESIWQRSPVHRLDREPGWLCSLFLVFVFGAQMLEGDALQDAVGLQRRYLRLVRERFHQLALTASLSNVQALLLLQLYEHNAGERNTSWILLGQAARMAIALGMHREGTSHNFDAIERNTRRMVWYTLYSFEQYTSLSLGRPSTIKALDVNVRLPDEAVVDGNDYPPDYFFHALTLLDLTSKVRHFATAASPHCFEETFLIAMADSLAAFSKELKSWAARLPRHLRPEWSFISPRHLRAVLLLHVNYHYLCSVLTRPYLLFKVERDIRTHALQGPRPSMTTEGTITKLAQECITSSISVTDMLHRLASESLLEGLGWTDFFFLYHAMLVLCLDFLGRPPISAVDWTVGDREISAHVSFMMEMCQTHKLGPTYQILSQVAIQLAHIVGLAGDDGLSRDDSEHMISETTVQGASVTKDNTNAEAPTLAPLNQHDIFMPFPEPISNINEFGNADAFWDFFNVNGVDPMDTSFNSAIPYMTNFMPDQFGYTYPTDSNHYNNWPS